MTQKRRNSGSALFFTFTFTFYLSCSFIFTFIFTLPAQAAGPANSYPVTAIPGDEVSWNDSSISDYFCSRVAASHQSRLLSEFKIKLAEEGASVEEAAGQSVINACLGDELKAIEVKTFERCQSELRDQNERKTTAYLQKTRSVVGALLSERDIEEKFQRVFRPQILQVIELAQTKCLNAIEAVAIPCQAQAGGCEPKKLEKLTSPYRSLINFSDFTWARMQTSVEAMKAADLSWSSEGARKFRTWFNSKNFKSLQKDKIRSAWEYYHWDILERAALIQERKLIPHDSDPLGLLGGRRASSLMNAELEKMLEYLQEQIESAKLDPDEAGSGVLLLNELALMEEYYNRVFTLKVSQGFFEDLKRFVVAPNIPTPFLSQDYVLLRVRSLSLKEFNRFLALSNQRVEPLVSPIIKRAIETRARQELDQFFELEDYGTDSELKSLLYSYGAYLGSFVKLSQSIRAPRKSEDKYTSRVRIALDYLREFESRELDHVAIWQISLGKERASYYQEMGQQIRIYTLAGTFERIVTLKPPKSTQDWVAVGHPIMDVGTVCLLGPAMFAVSWYVCAVGLVGDVAQYAVGAWVHIQNSLDFHSFEAAVNRRKSAPNDYYRLGAELLKIKESGSSGDSAAVSAGGQVLGYGLGENNGFAAGLALKFGFGMKAEKLMVIVMKGIFHYPLKTPGWLIVKLGLGPLTWSQITVLFAKSSVRMVGAATSSALNALPRLFPYLRVVLR